MYNVTMNSSKVPTKIDKVFQVSNFFIVKAKEDGKEITNKKIQKLLYYSQAWSLVLRDSNLFKEPIEAWVHGPAIRKVYDRFSIFGRNDIASQYNLKDLDISDLSSDEKDFLEVIWDNYGKYSAGDLEMLTHSEEPWQKAREGVEPYMASTNEITVTAMKAYYGKKKKRSWEIAKT